MLKWTCAAVAALVACAPAMAASERFALEYRVERADAGRLSVPACLATAERASAAIGYVPALRNTFQEPLAVFSSGPRGGGAALIVTCIGVGPKTAYVVQAIDYFHPESPAAKRAAGAVAQALLRASR